jgi:hypothetical protein
MDADLYHQTFLLREAEVTRELELRRRAAERADRERPAHGTPARDVPELARHDARRWARALAPGALRRRFAAPADDRRRTA